MRLVLVHGRSQQGKSAEELRLFWEGCIDGAFFKAGLSWPKDTKVVLPFYADDLETLVQQVDAPLMTGILLRGDKTVQNEEALRVEMLHEILYAKGNADRIVLAHFEGQAVERGVQNWRWVLAMVRALDATPLGGNAIDAITRDVWVYMTFRGIQEKINAIVNAAVPDGPFVLVAHSLGTIVAYNVLSQRLNDDAKVPLLVTLGSPLGIHAIASRMTKPLAKPPIVEAWLNARDARDAIALYPLDREHFDVLPPIENYSGVDNFTDNRHSVDGYLADPLVVGRIHAALSG